MIAGLHGDLRVLRLSLLSAMAAIPACTTTKDTGTAQGDGVGGGVGGDGSGGDGSDGGDGTDGGDGGETSSCTDPTPIVDGSGAATGYVQCADGAINRTSAEPASTVIGLSTCEGTEASRSCETDADCTDGAHALCAHHPDEFGEGTSCGCVYACATDADCATGEICLTPDIVDANPWATCIPAECTVDADCGTDECGISRYHDGCSVRVTATCREPADDACRVDTECTDQCGVDWGETDWDCLVASCDIGRPYVDVETGKHRTAPAVGRRDWRDAPVALALPENTDLRAILARRWASIARMEHASVASFARFTLELMAMGAPPELLLASQQAAMDEVAHARAIFTLASAAAGQPIGPGPMDLGTTPPATDRRAVMTALIREACVGETIGVAEAQAAVRCCVDPHLRATLQTIADDEARHAALAWRTLGWLLAEGDPALRREAQDILEQAIAEILIVPEEPGPDLAPWGVLSSAARRTVREHAVMMVVRPCMGALA